MRVPLGVITFLVFVTAGFAQALSVDWTRPISEFDEIAHIDYAERLTQGSITTWDDVYSQRTLGIGECVDAQSPDPLCVTAAQRDPVLRWPDGHSYEAQQGPIGYLPYAAALATVIPADADHFAQIRSLRWVNMALWIALAALWSLLLAQVTARWWPSIAVTIVVATNPLLFDAFTYVNNDAAAAVIGTGTVLWLLWLLRNPQRMPVGLSILVSGAIGIVVALTKVTALAVVIPIALGVLITKRRWRIDTQRQWWGAVASLTGAAIIVEMAYLFVLEARSTLDSHAAFSLMLPRGPLDLPESAVVRLTDIADLVLGSGAHTDQVLRDSGMQTATFIALAFALSSAATFLIALGMPTLRFDKLPNLQSSGLGYGLFAAAAIVLLLMPTIWEVSGGYLTTVPIGRYLTPLVPIAALVTVPVYARFTRWAQVTVFAGILVAAFGAGPMETIVKNVTF